MSGETKRYLFDTNAVVSLLRGHPELLALSQEAEWVGISVITHLEFLAFPGISAEDIELFARFVERIEVVDLDHRQLTLLQKAHRLAEVLPSAAAGCGYCCIGSCERCLPGHSRPYIVKPRKAQRGIACT